MKTTKTGLTFNQISKLTYNQLGKALTAGEVSEKWLKDYYTTARKKAVDRYRKVSKTEEFGNLEKQHFSKLKNLTTTSDLLHAISDVNRYLGSKRSTITGLKQEREQVLQTLEFHGFSFIDESNYGNWTRFISWFKSTEYARYFDSNSEELEEVFVNNEASSPVEWAKAFEEFLEMSGLKQ